MSQKIPFKNFDIEKFKAQEFPIPTGKYPDASRMINHLDKITGLLSLCASQSVKNFIKEEKDHFTILHNNTRYTIAWNFRIRTLSLIKIFSEIMDVEGKSIFDEGTATIILRSLLESYLVYYQLYNLNQTNPALQAIYFNMYDLSSRLQVLKQTKNIPGLTNPPTESLEFKGEIERLTNAISIDNDFALLPKKTQQAIKRIQDGKQDYLSFVNFNDLIKSSPLPSNFIGDYYSYASAFAHSEESQDNWKSINDLLKFRLLYFALSIASQFFICYTTYDHTELEDEAEQELCEVLILVDFYLKAMSAQQ